MVDKGGLFKVFFVLIFGASFLPLSFWWLILLVWVKVPDSGFEVLFSMLEKSHRHSSINYRTVPCNLDLRIQILLSENFKAWELSYPVDAFIFEIDSVNVRNRDSKRLQIMTHWVPHEICTLTDLLHMISHLFQSWCVEKPLRRDTMDLLAWVCDHGLRVDQSVEEKKALFINKCDFDRDDFGKALGHLTVNTHIQVVCWVAESVASIHDLIQVQRLGPVNLGH